MKKERKGNWQEKQTEQTGRPNNNPKPSINSKQPPDNTLHFTLTLQHQSQGHHPTCQRIKVKRSNGKGILTLYYYCQLTSSFFVGAQTVVSLLQTTEIKQGVSFTVVNKVYTSANKTTIV